MGTGKTITHDRLVVVAGKWLKKKPKYNITIPNCNIILMDMHTAHIGRPDVIGFSSGMSVLLEVKVSRGDFLADRNKKLRKDPSTEVGDIRYYVCPKGMIEPDELPHKWGLLYYDNETNEFEVIKESAMFKDANLKAERTMLVSLLRRAKVGGNI